MKAKKEAKRRAGEKTASTRVVMSRKRSPSSPNVITFTEISRHPMGNHQAVTNIDNNPELRRTSFRTSADDGQNLLKCSSKLSRVAASDDFISRPEQNGQDSGIDVGNDSLEKKRSKEMLKMTQLEGGRSDEIQVVVEVNEKDAVGNLPESQKAPQVNGAAPLLELPIGKTGSFRCQNFRKLIQTFEFSKNETSIIFLIAKILMNDCFLKM